jgi:quercetin dioxygenase-like cupin family protein
MPSRIDRVRALSARGYGASRVTPLSSPREIPGASVVWLRVPPGVTIPPIYHRRSSELVIVVAGRARGFVGRRKVRMTPGTVLFIEKGTARGLSAGPEGLSCVVVLSPYSDPSKPDVYLAGTNRLLFAPKDVGGGRGRGRDANPSS